MNTFHCSVIFIYYFLSTLRILSLLLLYELRLCCPYIKYKMRFRFILLIQIYIHDVSLVQLTRSRRLFVLSPVHLAYDHDKFMEYTFLNEFLAFADIWQRNVVCSVCVCNTVLLVVAAVRIFLCVS